MSDSHHDDCHSHLSKIKHMVENLLRLTVKMRRITTKSLNWTESIIVTCSASQDHLRMEVQTFSLRKPSVVQNNSTLHGWQSQKIEKHVTCRWAEGRREISQTMVHARREALRSRNETSARSKTNTDELETVVPVILNFRASPLTSPVLACYGKLRFAIHMTFTMIG
jgi:hypothetical protein